MADKITSVIRTAAVLVAGFLINLALKNLGVDLSEYSADLEKAMTVVFSLAYYVLIRWLASYEKLSWLEYFLIVPKSPVYVKPPDQEKASKFLKQNQL